MTKPTVEVLDERQKAHDSLCIMRHASIEKRLGRIETVLLSVVGTSVCGLVAALYNAWHLPN